MVILKIFYNDGEEIQECLKDKDIAIFIKEQLERASEVKKVDIYDVIK